jgi:SAM-dependent methyltransferase
MAESVRERFEHGFLGGDLPTRIAACDHNELAPILMEMFSGHQPVLEAGCGDGRWNGWLANRGIRSDGVDWSEELCTRAAHALPNCAFYAADLRSIPVPDGAYGGLMALGSVEHVPEGPMGVLREFHRVLSDDGVALVTVPHGGCARRISRLWRSPMYVVRANAQLRRLFGKAPIEGTSLAEAIRTTRPEYWPRLQLGECGWFFFEYEFSSRQMRRALGDASFRVDRVFPAFGSAGLIATLGSIAGRWDSDREEAVLTAFGRLCLRLLPLGWVAHQRCYVVRKA